MATIIDGKMRGNEVREEIAREVVSYKKESGRTPKLTVVLVGEDSASKVYVRSKEKACLEAGLDSEVIKFSEKASEAELIRKIEELNNDKRTDGILVQLPLPKGLSETKVLNAISPLKDVDGLHPLNMGKLLKWDNPTFIPCTPLGMIDLLNNAGIEIKGKNAVVLGRSNIVGKPMACLLLHNHATVTVCHSRTTNLAEVTRSADILVVAVGSPGIVHGEMIKPGAVVLDVGVNRVGGKLVGDVEFDSAAKVASHITPVPGGVGPMTIAMLLKNTLRAAQLAK